MYKKWMIIFIIILISVSSLYITYKMTRVYCEQENVILVSTGYEDYVYKSNGDICYTFKEKDKKNTICNIKDVKQIVTQKSRNIYFLKKDFTVWKSDLGNNNTITQISINEDIVQITTGYDELILLSDKGNVFTYKNDVLEQVEIPEKIIKVAAGEAHFLALDLNGVIWSWGKNNQGQLGLGDRIDRESPQKINMPIKFVDIQDTRDICSIAIGEDGQTYAWGDGFSLGVYECYPAIVSLDTDIKELKFSDSVIVAKNNHNDIFIWGYVKYHGRGVIPENVPQKIYTLKEDIEIFPIGDTVGWIDSNNRLMIYRR